MIQLLCNVLLVFSLFIFEPSSLYFPLNGSSMLDSLIDDINSEFFFIFFPIDSNSCFCSYFFKRFNFSCSLSFSLWLSFFTINEFCFFCCYVFELGWKFSLFWFYFYFCCYFSRSHISLKSVHFLVTFISVRFFGFSWTMLFFDYFCSFFFSSLLLFSESDLDPVPCTFFDCKYTLLDEIIVLGE